MSTKMIVIRIPQDLHTEIANIQGAREVPFRDALESVVRAGISRIWALDRHAQGKRAKAKAAKKVAKRNK